MRWRRMDEWVGEMTSEAVAALAAQACFSTVRSHFGSSLL